MSYTKKQYRNGSPRGPVDSQGKPIRTGEPTYTATSKRRLTVKQKIKGGE